MVEFNLHGWLKKEIDGSASQWHSEDCKEDCFPTFAFSYSKYINFHWAWGWFWFYTTRVSKEVLDLQKRLPRVSKGLDRFTDWWHTTGVVSVEIGFDVNNKEWEVLKDNVQKQFREAVEHFDLSQSNSSHKGELNCDWWNLFIVALYFLYWKLTFSIIFYFCLSLCRLHKNKWVVYEGRIFRVGKV